SPRRTPLESESERPAAAGTGGSPRKTNVRAEWADNIGSVTPKRDQSFAQRVAVGTVRAFAPNWLAAAPDVSEDPSEARRDARHEMSWHARWAGRLATSRA